MGLIPAVFSQSCQVSASPSVRTQYQSGDQTSVLFDINVVNTGSCAVTGITLYYGVPNQGIDSYWNIIPDPGQPYIGITGFGPSLAPQQSYSGAGFISRLNISVTDYVPTNEPQLSVHSVQCSACASVSNQPALDITQFFATGPRSEPPTAQVTLPPYYKLIGGGFTSPSSGYSAGQSYPLNANTWFVKLRGHTADQGPATVTAYAIAVYDPFNQYETQIFQSAAAGAGQASGTASIAVASGYTLTCGGGSTDEFLTANWPNTLRADATSASTWTASFSLDAGAAPGAYSEDGVVAYAIGIRSTVAGQTIGNVVSSYFTAYTPNQQVPNQVTSFGALPTPLTPGSRLSGGGYQATNAQVFASNPVNYNVWSSFALPTNTSDANIIGYEVALSISQAASAASSSAEQASSGSESNSCSTLTIAQTLVSSWGTGSQWTVTLTNTGSSAVSSLDLLAAAPASISQLWSMTDNGAGHYALPSWIQAIAPSGSIQFGYLATSNAKVDFSCQ